MADGELTTDGTRLVREWLHSKDRVENTERELHRAKTDQTEAAKALAKWMLPDDAKPGEKIAVWYVDSLIQVEVPLQSHMEPPITIRTRGRKLRAA